ncbi:MAG: SDR family oxidoreductase [Nannocystaceae bacterium]
MSQRTVLVTGSNRGIGLEFCRQFQSRGDRVIAVCRTPSAELVALGVKTIVGIDVTSERSVARLSEQLGADKLSMLVNNAGLLRRSSLDQPNWEQIQAQFEVNALGPLRVSAALLTSLERGSKIAILTSRMGSMADNGSGGSYGYRMSKAAVNAAGKSLSVDLRARGIAVGLFHPGYVQTEMTGHAGDVTPEVAASRLMARFDVLSLDNTGCFEHANGEELPW